MVSEFEARLVKDLEIAETALRLVAEEPSVNPDQFKAPWLEVFERHSHTGAGSYKKAVARHALGLMEAK